MTMRAFLVVLAVLVTGCRDDRECVVQPVPREPSEIEKLALEELEAIRRDRLPPDAATSETPGIDAIVGMLRRLCDNRPDIGHLTDYFDARGPDYEGSEAFVNGGGAFHGFLCYDEETKDALVLDLDVERVTRPWKRSTPVRVTRLDLSATPCSVMIVERAGWAYEDLTGTRYPDTPIFDKLSELDDKVGVDTLTVGDHVLTFSRVEFEDGELTCRLRIVPKDLAEPAKGG
jgi:hypothetical protein